MHYSMKRGRSGQTNICDGDCPHKLGTILAQRSKENCAGAVLLRAFHVDVSGHVNGPSLRLAQGTYGQSLLVGLHGKGASSATDTLETNWYNPIPSRINFII